MNEYQDQGAYSGFNQPSGNGSGVLITPELLHSFVIEVKGYLPRIESGITDYFNDPAVIEHLAEAHGYAHTVKKAAHVMGMLPLANIAERLQSLLEQLAIGALPLEWSTLHGFRQVVSQFGIYLDHSALISALPPAELTEALYALEHPVTHIAVTEAAEVTPSVPEPASEPLDPSQMYVLSDEFQTAEASLSGYELATPLTEHYAETMIDAFDSEGSTLPADLLEAPAESQPIQADWQPAYELTSPCETASQAAPAIETSQVTQSDAPAFIPTPTPITSDEPWVMPVAASESEASDSPFVALEAPTWWSQDYVEESMQSSPYAVTSHLDPSLQNEATPGPVYHFTNFPNEVVSDAEASANELRTTQELPAIRFDAGELESGESATETALEFEALPLSPLAPSYPPLSSMSSVLDENLVLEVMATTNYDMPTKDISDTAYASDAWTELPWEPGIAFEAEAFMVEPPSEPVIESPIESVKPVNEPTDDPTNEPTFEESRPSLRLGDRLADFGTSSPKPTEGWGTLLSSSGSLASSTPHSRSDWATRYAQPDPSNIQTAAQVIPQTTIEPTPEATSAITPEASLPDDEGIPTARLPKAVVEACETAMETPAENSLEACDSYISWEGEARARTPFDAQTVWGQRHWMGNLPDTLSLGTHASPETPVVAETIASESQDLFAHLLSELSPDPLPASLDQAFGPVETTETDSNDWEETSTPNDAPSTVAAVGKKIEWDMPAELLEVFLPEAEEHLAVITTSLPKLAAQPENKNLLQEIRRSSHSLKGSSAVVGFQGMTKLAHRMEDLLDLLYDSDLMLTPEMLDLLFSSTEALENLLNNQSEPELIGSLYAAYDRILGDQDEAAHSIVPQLEMQPHGQLKALTWMQAESVPPLRNLGASLGLRATLSESLAQRAMALALEPGEDARETASTINVEAIAEAPTAVAPSGALLSVAETSASKEAQGVPVGQNNYVRLPIERLDAVIKLVTELIVNRATLEQNMGQFNRQLEELQGNAQRLSRVANRMEVQYEASTLGSGLPAVATTGVAGGRFTNALGEVGKSAVTGVTGKLTAPEMTSNTYGFDALEFDRYTEFHLLLRELAECAGDLQTMERELLTIRECFESALNRQGRLNSEMQDQLMRLRMVPLASLSARLHRTAHQVAQQCNKQVNFTIEGEDTRLDKTVIEEMIDPLLHILRNAIDHGIEPTLVRQSTGKPGAGNVRLRAFHEGTQTVLQITDDGMGLHPEHLRAKAIQFGVVTAKDAAHLTDDELFSLIFLPGFTTAAEVSEISGRGVGMDVVKTTIRRLKGRVELESKVGVGTTFTIRLPMTLAVMRALLVKVHKQTFAIPPTGLQQIIRLTPDMLDRVGEQHVIRINDKIYPLMQLGRLLNLRRTAAKVEGPQLALLMNLEERQFAIAVDETLGGREVVVKNLGNHIREVRGVTGTTLMGDGSVVLILNLPELIRDLLRPASRSGQPMMRRARMRPPIEPRGPLTIMVVDDSLSVRRVLANRLNAAGWKPIQAKDGLDALEQLQHNTRLPDAILLDIEMPRMDGYEFLSALRKNPDYAQIPVVMITSRAGQKHRDRAFEAGANEYLIKPYQDEDLLTRIRRLAQVTE